MTAQQSHLEMQNLNLVEEILGTSALAVFPKIEIDQIEAYVAKLKM